MANVEEDLLDYEEEQEETTTNNATQENNARPAKETNGSSTTGASDAKKNVKGAYASIHSSGFRDFLLKPEILRAIIDCGFEHPSEVQHECIPQAILGMDIVCQAKSGMGKTAVFVLATLQQLEPVDGQVSCLVMCHTRELAFQISKEYERFSKYLPGVKVSVFFGGMNIKKDEDTLKSNTPHIVVGTPGRILALARSRALNLKNVKFFILDECDKMLGDLDMRRDVQEIFKMTPHEKQVAMFSATLSKELRPVCKKFMQDPMEVYVDDEAKLTLHGLQQYYVKLKENEKNKKLFELLDVLEFNQVVIFVKTVQRCMALNQLLCEQNFPSIAIHRNMPQEERLSRYQQFKDFQKRILVATNLFGRGMDIERVNIVFNYDMPEDSDTYLHRVARAGRFGTKGLALTFVSDENDAKILNEVQQRFNVDIDQLPDEIEVSSYKKMIPFFVFIFFIVVYQIESRSFDTLQEYRATVQKCCRERYGETMDGRPSYCMLACTESFKSYSRKAVVNYAKILNERCGRQGHDPKLDPCLAGEPIVESTIERTTTSSTTIYPKIDDHRENLLSFIRSMIRKFGFAGRWFTINDS